MEIIIAFWNWLAGAPIVAGLLTAEALAAAGVIGYLLGRRART
jgi:hypothetical protein